MPSEPSAPRDRQQPAAGGQPFEPCRMPLGGDAADPTQIRDALRQTEEFNRRIIESSRDCIKVLDLEGNLLFISSAGPRALKIPDPSRLLHTSFLNFWDEPDRPMVAAAIAAGRSGKVGQFRAYCRSAWAEPRYWDVLITPIGDADGRPERLLCISRDVTECHEAEREREAAVEFLRGVSASAGLRELIEAAVAFFQRQSGCDAVGIRLTEGEDYPYYRAGGFPESFLLTENSLCVRDGSGNIRRDAHGESILECMCGRVIRGQRGPFATSFTPAGSFWTNSTSQFVATATQPEQPAGFRNRCNSEGYESVALIPLRSGARCLGLLQLSDRRTNRFKPEIIAAWERLADYLAVAVAKSRAEEALRASEERLRLAIESANLGTWDFDPTTGRLAWSDRSKAAFGLPADAPVDFPTLLSRLHPEDRHLVEDMGKHVGTPGESREFQIEYRSRWPDGTERSILATGKTLFGVVDGRPAMVRCVGTLRDLTDSKRAEELNARLTEELRQSQKMQAIGQLAGGVAHNFNNLLLAISGHVEVMADAVTRLPASEDQRTCLHSVGQLRNAVDVGTGVTRRLLAFCRGQPLHPVLLEPGKAIAEMLEMLRDVLGPRIMLSLESTGDVGYLHTDLDQIQQAIVNFVLNGRDAMPEGGKLAIRTSRIVVQEADAAQRGIDPGTFVSITVSDTGRGMDAATRKRLFEPFFTTKPLGQGTGLGLATVYGFVKQAGGCIDVESEPGRGTTFTLLMPAACDAPASTDSQPAAAPQTVGQTILFCDDDRLIRPLIGQYLSDRGYVVLEAEDAEQALEMAQSRAGSIDVLVTDIQLPGIDGLELARLFKRRRPDAKCVLITGHPECLPEEDSLADLEATFLPKPFQLAELLAVIRACLVM